MSKCDGCEECDVGVCVDCCQDCGGFCDFTFPAWTPCIADLEGRCENAGASCHWELTNGGGYNDTCPCCTLDFDACAEVVPWLCHEEIVWDPFPHYVCVCNDSEMGSWGYPIGSRATCP